MAVENIQIYGAVFRVEPPCIDPQENESGQRSWLCAAVCGGVIDF